MIGLLVEPRKDSGNNHRGRLDIIADILEASYYETRKTYLMYRCNMSFKQMRDYLEFLLRKDLLYTINEDAERNSVLIKITDKGRRFLRAYKGLKALVK
jgi:predicted transcriptional regulator